MNFMYVTLHVTDLERSIAFYEKLGFAVIFDPNRHEPTTMPVFELKDRLEFDGGLQKGAILSLRDHPRATTLLVLVQFIDPPATPKPFKPKQEAGTHRIALRGKDLTGFWRSCGRRASRSAMNPSPSSRPGCEVAWRCVGPCSRTRTTI